MNSFQNLVIMFFVIFKIIHSEDLPSFIHVCHRSDPNLEQCVLESIEDIKPYLVTGVPEYDIPSLEPLVMPDLISEEAAGLKIVTSNVSAFGCSNFSVKSLTIDKVTHLYNILINIPKLRIFADYKVDGKLLIVPLRGNGNLEANVTDCVSTCKLQGEIYEKNGEKYLRFTSVDLKVQVGGGHVRLENLFNGDKVLLGAINDVVNRNLNAFLQELLPLVEKALAGIFIKIGNTIVGRFTFDQLWPI